MTVGIHTMDLTVSVNYRDFVDSVTETITVTILDFYADLCSDFEIPVPACEETCFTIGLSCENSNSCDDSVSSNSMMIYDDEETACQPVIDGDCSDPCCLPSVQYSISDLVPAANWYILRDQVSPVKMPFTVSFHSECEFCEYDKPHGMRVNLI